MNMRMVGSQYSTKYRLSLYTIFVVHIIIAKKIQSQSPKKEHEHKLIRSISSLRGSLQVFIKPASFWNQAQQVIHFLNLVELYLCVYQ